MTKSATIIDDLESRAATFALPNGAGTTRWRVWGEGRPVVLLHGGWGSWRHWIRNIGPLSQSFRVLVPDMPGFGDSDGLQETSVAAIAESLAENLERLLVSDTYCLAGFSFGAWAAGHLLAHHRDRISRLVIVGAGGLGRVNSQRDAMRSWRVHENRDDQMKAHRHNLSLMMLADPDAVDDTAVLIQARNAEATRFRHRLANDPMLLKDCLENWPVKLTAIWGENDVVVKGHLDERREAVRAIDPEGEFHVVPNAGHWVQYEAADRVNALMMAACRREDQPDHNPRKQERTAR